MAYFELSYNEDKQTVNQATPFSLLCSIFSGNTSAALWLVISDEAANILHLKCLMVRSEMFDGQAAFEILSQYLIWCQNREFCIPTISVTFQNRQTYIHTFFSQF